MSIFTDVFKKHDSPKNPALERAMRDVARQDDAKTRKSLYKAILASTFIVRGSASGGTELSKGDWIADSNTRVAFKTIEHPPGTIVLPVFTDVEALTSWAGSEVEWIALRAQDLFQSIVPGKINEVRVNPFRPEQAISRPGGIITRNEFVALAQGLLPQSNISNVAQMKVAASQKLLIGRPANEPSTEVLKALADHFQKIPELEGAYLFQMANRNVTSTVIGLHFVAEPNAQHMEQIMGGIGHVVQGVMPAGMSIDFMPLTTGPLLDSVQKCGKALLRR